jgi:lipoprotein-releasing system ATP-binding protein
MRLPQPLASRWQDVRDVMAALRGFERPATTVAVTSLALVLLEGASLTLLVPFLESFKQGAAPRLQLIVLGIGALILLRAGAAYLNGVLTARLELRVLLRLRESLVKAIYASRYAELAAFGGGRLVNLFSTQTERVIASISALVSLLNAVLLLAVYGGTLVVLSWRLSLAAAVLGVIGFGLTAYATRRIGIYSVGMVRAEEDSSRLALDDAAGLHVVQAYDAGAARLTLHRQVNEALYREAMGLHRWRSAVGPVTETLYVVVLLGGLLVALNAWQAQLFANLPLVLAFVFVLHRLQGRFGAITEAASALAQQQGATLNVFDFLRDRASPAPDGTAEVRAPVERIRVEQVAYGYREGEPVLHGLDLELRRGEVVAVVGASGSGKSTFLHILGLLDAPDGGTVSVSGQRIDNRPERHRDAMRNRLFGFIFQFYHLLPELTALENVMMPRLISHGVWSYWKERSRIRREAAELLERVGLGHRLDHLPSELSGGEMQRAAIARALAGGPAILLADEPTGNLDAASGQGVIDLLRDLNRERGLTMMMVTHDQQIALQADRVVRLTQGRIEEWVPALV